MSSRPGVITPDVNLNESLWRFSGQSGRALDLNGNLLHEVVTVDATVQVDRVNVPLAGSRRTGHKPGRLTREGTLTVQKLDTAWEMSIYNWLSQTAEQLRQNRGTALAFMRPFSVILDHSDETALGYEQWQLDGCLIWALPMGMNIGDDIVQREFPLTWEAERPLHAFQRTGAVDANGVPAVTYVGYLDQK
jgi:hypothetical protein